MIDDCDMVPSRGPSGPILRCWNVDPEIGNHRCPRRWRRRRRLDAYEGMWPVALALTPGAGNAGEIRGLRAEVLRAHDIGERGACGITQRRRMVVDRRRLGVARMRKAFKPWRDILAGDDAVRAHGHEAGRKQEFAEPHRR